MRGFPDQIRGIVAGTVLAASLAMPLVSSAGVAAQDGPPDAANAAPEDAVLYFELDLDFEGEQWQMSDGLLARVGVPDALNTWRQEFIVEGATSGEFSEADLDALLGGEVALVATPLAVDRLLELQAMMASASGDMNDGGAAGATPMAGMESGPIGITMIMTPGDPAAAWDYVLRQSQSWAEKKDLDLQEASGPGENLVWAEGSAPGGDSAWEGDPLESVFGHDAQSGFAVGQSGDYIVAGSNVDDVTTIFDVIKGATPSLAADAEFVDLTSRIPADNVSMAFLDMTGIIDQLDDEVKQSLESFLPEGTSADAVGSTGVLAIGADANGFRMNSVSTVSADVDAAQLVAENNEFAVNAAATAPAGTFIFSAGEAPPSTFSGAAFGLAQAVNESSSGDSSPLGEMEAIPSAEEIDAEIAKAAETLGFNPATDLFDLLGGEFIFFAPFPSLSFDDFSWDAVAAVQTSDSARLAETMVQIANLAKGMDDGASVTVRKLDADTIYKLADPENAGSPSFEFGVLGDRAVAALGNGIASLTTPPDSSLADDAQYQDVMGMFPSEFAQVTYVDISQAAGPLMMLTGQFQTAGISDADVACVDYETQEAAQAAYEEDPIAQMDLDMDFDGTACEDAFVTAGASPVAAVGSLANIRAMAAVTYRDGDYVASDSLLYIPAPTS